ncbi:alpha/beta hydrolase [Anabaena cylindrica FACHB-243]|uniref:Alpha/beta hydrolase fold protein n=1 Tax=Anabaena cylindrica (strain ATCC 27899 / PCC 7122) TaxID=272123 RepID=K9ZAP4_ANACC|nr:MULTISPECIES: alpha/beta hydrolase [Anabaena]AFZ56258.1 alpha/beta hydrolase fold protein [Anabaena cylindrica PCC 7122]MBD2417486.1 alpha/beta hydrolase [Anabaena cylindrica FACHB-243]MBY5285080.1 alpha/beta hydrolase [Anabaena sp. CCAP 1446/1C]MBY5307419.1 alpha/beta hydrolase [Anabaena sp. CCAP 1446/1C]MCM2407654.1 alpha/beta hydrolase [Anabaena sp. CCAP 1446/1C]
MSTNLLTKPVTTAFGGEVKEFLWNWENQQLRVIYETIGQGSPLLLLPAFSSVSTRGEVGELAQLLASHFKVTAIDWPGFGESDRLNLDYNPAIYQQFLANFVKYVFAQGISVVAAGHSAGYVLQLAVTQPDTFTRIVLVAPTWRGPLPTMGANANIAAMVRGLVRSPIIGQALYKLNTTPSFLSWMYSRHVFTDTAKLTPDFITEKWQSTQQPNARFASAAFVTGNIDTIYSQTEFLSLVQSLSAPLMAVIGESSPPKSRQEMDALAALPGVSSIVIPGSLGLHEEYPAAVFEAILPFLLTGLPGDSK